MLYASVSEGLERRNCHDLLRNFSKIGIKGDERIGLQLSQGQVLGVKRVRRTELVCDLPRDTLQNSVTQESNPQPADVVELPLGILLGQVATLHRSV